MAHATITINVQGMTCGGCASKVDAALVATDGISGTEIDVPTGAVTIHLDGTVGESDLEFAIDEAVHAVGYTISH
jgi:copper chaperone CopZ